jgi:uncharacterized protein (DUF3084 family)
MLRATIVSVSGENDKNLINFIASTVETLRDQIEVMRTQMVTKDDLAAVKEQMASKKELASVKDDLARIENQMATKDELAAVKDQMATKNELTAVKEQMVTKIDLLETTMHGEFEQVHLRLDSIDRSLSNRIGQVESEVSRLRSVIYWLVKDKPDMLRLLGQPTPGENRPQG